MKIVFFALYSLVMGYGFTAAAMAQDDAASKSNVYERPPSEDDDFLPGLKPTATPGKIPSSTRGETAGPEIELPPLPGAQPKETTATSTPTAAVPSPAVSVPTPLTAPTIVVPTTAPLPTIPAVPALPMPPVPSPTPGTTEPAVKKNEPTIVKPIIVPAPMPPLVPNIVTTVPTAVTPAPATPQAVPLVMPAEQPLKEQTPLSTGTKSFSVYDASKTEKPVAPVVPTILPEGKNSAKKEAAPLPSNPVAITPPESAKAVVPPVPGKEAEKDTKKKKKLSKDEIRRKKEQDAYEARQLQRSFAKAIADKKIWRIDALNYKTQSLPSGLYNTSSAENSGLSKPLTPSDYRHYLLDAAADGDNNAIQALVVHTHSKEVKGDNGNTPLIYATAQNQIDTVRLLLGKGVNVNATNNNNATALHVASFLGNTEITTALLSMGANPNIRDNNGKIALHYAVNNSNPALVKMLILNQSNPNVIDHNHQTPLDYALAKGDNTVMDTVLGAKLDNATLNNALFSATNLQQPELITRFLSKGANINARNAEGYTPLMVASLNGSDMIATLLVQKNAKVTLLDRAGRKASQLAEIQGYFALAEILQAEELHESTAVAATTSHFSSSYKPIPSQALSDNKQKLSKKKKYTTSHKNLAKKKQSVQNPPL